LDSEFGFGVAPFHGVIDTGNHAGSAFEAAGELDRHLAFFREGVQVGRTGMDAKTFLARKAGLLIEKDMRVFVIFKCVEGQLLRDFHETAPTSF